MQTQIAKGTPYLQRGKKRPKKPLQSHGAASHNSTAGIITSPRYTESTQEQSSSDEHTPDEQLVPSSHAIVHTQEFFLTLFKYTTWKPLTQMAFVSFARDL